jgi:hypothetical protein
MVSTKPSCGRAAAYLIVALLSVALGGCLGTAKTSPRAKQVTVAPIGPGRAPAETAARAMTAEELDQQLRRFADRFRSRTFLAVDRILEENPTPRQRTAANMFLTAGYAAAIDIAIGPNPVANLLDMLVLVSLNRMTVEAYWVPEVFGPELGQNLMEASRALEKDIWALSAKVLTPEQQEDLRALIRTWHEAHPEERDIWSVRLGEFSGQQAAALERVAESGGLLSQVQRTRETVDEVRILGERVLYYMQRAPFLLQGQVLLGFSRIAGQPEVARALGDWRRVSESMERIARQAELLPEQRLKAIDQLFDNLDEQRRAFMKDLTSEEAGVRPVLGDLQQVLTLSSVLVEQMHGLADQLRIGDPNKKRLDPNEYRVAIAQAGDTATKFRDLVQAMDQLMASPAWEQRVTEVAGVAHAIRDDATALLDRAFLLTAALIGVFFTALLVYRLVSARWTRH